MEFFSLLYYYLGLESLFALVVFWVYLFIYSQRNNFKHPWGFGIVIIGLSLSGISYAFYDNQITVFSINLMFLVCLIGLIWNINDIKTQLYIGNFRNLICFIVIGLISGLFLGFLAVMMQQTKYIQANGAYSVFALITSSLQVSLAEEFVFAGYFLGYLKKYGFNQVVAIVFQSLLFTILHIPRYSGDLIAIFLVFLGGAISGYLAWKSNNLIPSFVLHITINLIAVYWWLYV